MIADDVLVTDSVEPDGTPEPAKQQNNEAASFLDELARSESRKKLDLIGEIEIYVKSLEEQLKLRIDSFLQSECTVRFGEMALFQNVPLLVQDIASHTMFLSTVEETALGCFVIENSSARALVSKAVTGKIPESRSDSDFTPAEKRLFLVFASLLNTALNESIDGIAVLGEPQKAAIVDAQNFTELADSDDWVILTFGIEFSDESESLMLLVPLSLLNGEFLSNTTNHSSADVVIDTKWQSALFDHIENLKIPLTVEFGTVELPLSKLDRLEPGQAFDMKIDASNLRVFTEQGQALLRGGLEAKGNELKLKIIEKV